MLLKKVSIFCMLMALFLLLSIIVTAQDVVTITWRYPASDAAGLTDIESVESAVNDIITPAINVQLELMPVELGDYNTIMTTVAASGEECDLVYTAWWTFNYWQQSTLGAFTPLTDLLNEHAPNTLEKYPDYMWQTATVNGEIYGVPHIISAPGPHGWVLMSRLVDEYEFDISTIQDFDDVEPLLAQIRDGHPELITLTSGRNGAWEAYRNINNLEEIDLGIGFDRTADNIEVIDLYSTDQYQNYLTIARRWWEEGYIWDEAPLGSPGRIGEGVVATFTNRDLITPTRGYGGEDYVHVPLGPATIRRNTALSHTTAVCRTSQNPEAAVQVLELVRSNPELLRLLTYGLEGTHYQLTEDERAERIPDTGYSHGNRQWMFGDHIEDGYLWITDAPDFFDNYYAALEQGEPSPLLGFILDEEPISSELAQLQAVWDEFIPQLNTGAGDYTEVYPRMMDQRDIAGVDTVIAEIQRQIDEWQASQ